MLSSIGRAAIRRWIATPAATSPQRIVVSGLAANFSKPNREFIRTLTRERKKESVKVTRKTEQTNTKGRAKKPVQAKQTKQIKKPKATKKVKASEEEKPKRGRKRTPLTPERKAILERKELREAALFTEPKPLADTTWKLFIVEQTKNKSRNSTELRQIMVDLSQEFKALSSSALQQLSNTAEQNKLKNAAQYKAWVESHTPVEINNAIKARMQLKRKYNIPTKATVKTIHDGRLPKKPVTAFTLFTKARWASGDFKGRTVPEGSAEISREWKSLPDTERHAYDDLAKASSDQYEKDVASILHRAVNKRPSPKL
ncbi:hypothetical protein M426DRAFT_18925 [Hypoxylon sp. CI-4A]|nr:hypothetical protein M426DRAFT_18925 [Hypoxylon sp. CI-4A]